MIESKINLRMYIKSRCKKNHLGIEVGGGYRPLFKKKDGYNVLTIDHASREDLIVKYKDDSSVSDLLNDIENVDAIDDGSEFTNLLNLKNGSVDYIVGVHNFEHIPNPIRFLQRCQTALKDTGKLFLIIPDRRGTFDYFRPYTSIGQWVEAYRENRNIHSFSSLYDMFAYGVDGNGDYESVNFIHAPSAAHELAYKLYSPDSYRDTHGFVYTPASFCFLATYTRALGLTQLGIRKIIVPRNSNFEFLAILDKTDFETMNLNEVAIQMVSENINYRRSFGVSHSRVSNQQVALRHQLYRRFAKDWPTLAKIFLPFAKSFYHAYKRIKVFSQ